MYRSHQYQVIMWHACSCEPRWTLLTVLRSDFFRSVQCQACGDTQKPASHLCSGIHDYVAPRSLNSLIILWLAHVWPYTSTGLKIFLATWVLAYHCLTTTRFFRTGDTLDSSPSDDYGNQCTGLILRPENYNQWDGMTNIHWLCYFSLSNPHTVNHVYATRTTFLLSAEYCKLITRIRELYKRAIILLCFVFEIVQSVPCKSRSQSKSSSRRRPEFLWLPFQLRCPNMMSDPSSWFAFALNLYW